MPDLGSASAPFPLIYASIVNKTGRKPVSLSLKTDRTPRKERRGQPPYLHHEGAHKGLNVPEGLVALGEEVHVAEHHLDELLEDLKPSPRHYAVDLTWRRCAYAP